MWRIYSMCVREFLFSSAASNWNDNGNTRRACSSAYFRDAGRRDYLPVRLGGRFEQRKTDKNTQQSRWARVDFIFLKCATGVSAMSEKRTNVQSDKPPCRGIGYYLASLLHLLRACECVRSGRPIYMDSNRCQVIMDRGQKSAGGIKCIFVKKNTKTPTAIKINISSVPFLSRTCI